MPLKRFWDKTKTEAGCDEAGRGCLAGPVVAAAVILPPNFKNFGLNDSKQINGKTRNELRLKIEKKALAFAVSFVYPEEIDRINILNASFLAMHRCVAQLSTIPNLLLIDGNRFNPYPNIPHQCVIKGDAKFMSIAAASILAKTYRDEYMENLAKAHPHYQWEKNKGYPTREHRDAIMRMGTSEYHRKSFRQLPEQLSLFCK